MDGLTLDAGALIAIERSDLWARAVLKQAQMREQSLTVPAVVLAQVWRGPQSARVSRLIRVCTIEGMDESCAKRVGELLGRSRTSDIVDAAVAVGAAARGDIVLTSDPGDLERLRPFAIGSFRVQGI